MPGTAATALDDLVGLAPAQLRSLLGADRVSASHAHGLFTHVCLLATAVDAAALRHLRLGDLADVGR